MGESERNYITDAIDAIVERGPVTQEPEGHHMAACAECGLLRPHPGTASMAEALTVAAAHMTVVGHGVLILRVVARVSPQR